MGSKSFPYKGGLDLLSLNAMAVDGTNAFTAQVSTYPLLFYLQKSFIKLILTLYFVQDHTGYTVKTIGVQGMEQFIPIYVDHLLNPLLTDKNYKTEVYHINPEGVDAGVVYSEMQEHENMLEVMVHRARRAAQFPNNPCFSVETGGRLKEIRELCSLERVRNYHNTYYHLKNMWIYLCGSVDQESMLKQIDSFDSADFNKPPTEFIRPFNDCNIPDIGTQRDKPILIKGPADQEDEGMAEIGFLGRPASVCCYSRFQLFCFQDTEWIAAVNILGTYLSKTTSAPLQKEMILTPDPYCDAVYMGVDVLPKCEVSFSLSGVPLDKLEKVTEKFFTTVRENTTSETMDLERLKYIIERKIKKQFAKVSVMTFNIAFCVQLESNVSSAVFDGLTQFQLFADSYDNQDLFEKVVDPIPTLKSLLEKPVDYWVQICQEFFTDNATVVLGKPDPKVAKQINAAEKERLKDLAKNLDNLRCHVLEKDTEEEVSAFSS